MNYNILQIDAWVEPSNEPCDCEKDSNDNCRCTMWNWNNWFKVGTTDVIPETVQQFAELLECNDRFKPELYYVDDDQYNVVLCQVSDNMPLFAVEYGNHY